MKLTEAQRKELYEEESIDGMEYADSQNLGMDSHGCMCNLIVFRKQGDAVLYGFMVRESSEEIFFDDEEVYTLSSEQVTVTRYQPTNFDDWQW